MDQAAIDALGNIPVPSQRHIINGQAVAASDGQEMEVLSPLNGRRLRHQGRHGRRRCGRARGV